MEYGTKKEDKSTLTLSLLVLFTYTLNWFDIKTSAADAIKVNGSQTRRWNKKKQRYIYFPPGARYRNGHTKHCSNLRLLMPLQRAALEHRGGRIYFWNCSLPPHFPAISPPSLFSLHLPFIRQKNSQATLWGGTAPQCSRWTGGDYTQSITFCGRRREVGENSMEKRRRSQLSAEEFDDQRGNDAANKCWEGHRRNVDGNRMAPAWLEAMI